MNCYAINYNLGGKSIKFTIKIWIMFCIFIRSTSLKEINTVLTWPWPSSPLNAPSEINISILKQSTPLGSFTAFIKRWQLITAICVYAIKKITQKWNNGSLYKNRTVLNFGITENLGNILSSVWYWLFRCLSLRIRSGSTAWTLRPNLHVLHI